MRCSRACSLEVEEHQVVCLIGPSGCGKSTLLRCINGLESIEQGEIRIHGDRMTGPGVDVNALRRDVGIVFQSFNLFPHMTVLENVTLAALRVLRQDRKAAEATAMALLTRIGLEDKAKEYPDRLSGGQQQRVAIVRALAMGPMVMLLDEITSALDPELVAEVLNIVRDLARDGMTMLLATHEMGFAREVASKVCFLFDGRVHEEGPPAADLRQSEGRAHKSVPEADHRGRAVVGQGSRDATPTPVIPANAGIEGRHVQHFAARPWTPTFAGVTEEEVELFRPFRSFPLSPRSNAFANYSQSSFRSNSRSSEYRLSTSLGARRWDL